MSKTLIAVLALSLCLLISPYARAQSLLINDKIPKDLIITFETAGIGQHYKLVVKADGSVTYYPISVTAISIPTEEPNAFVMSKSDRKKFEKSKKPKIKNKLSQKQLKELIFEFEKINFFNLLSSYSTAADGCKSWISIPGWKSITIRANGKNKQVFYKSDCAEVANVSENFDNLSKKISEITKVVKVKAAK